jgi:hypothetical protein
MNIHQARTEAIPKIISKMDVHQERIKASMNAWQRDNSLPRSNGGCSGYL